MEIVGKKDLYLFLFFSIHSFCGISMSLDSIHLCYCCVEM